MDDRQNNHRQMQENKSPGQWREYWKNHRINSVLLVGLVAVNAANIASAISGPSDKEQYDEMRKQRYGVEYYQPWQLEAFTGITTLTPEDVNNARTIEEKVALGQKLQTQLAIVSEMSFWLGLDENLGVDEYNLALNLLAPTTRDALKEGNFRLKAVHPLPCGLIISDPGEYGYEPLYFSQTWRDFEVKVKKIHGKRVVKIPLGAMQEPLPIDPETADEVAKKFIGLPCKAYPTVTPRSEVKDFKKIIN